MLPRTCFPHISPALHTQDPIKSVTDPDDGVQLGGCHLLGSLNGSKDLLLVLQKKEKNSMLDIRRDNSFKELETPEWPKVEEQKSSTDWKTAAERQQWGKPREYFKR